MVIVVNGEPRQVNQSNLAQVVEELGFEPGNVATAHNGVFVPAAKRAQVELRHGESIEVLAPMQGG